MRILNELKTLEIKENDIDLALGYVKEDKLFVKHHPFQPEIKEKSHYEVINECKKTGGKEVKKVIDIPYQPQQNAYDEYEDILVYVKYPEDVVIRNRRETECFKYINRGNLFWDRLLINEERKQEVKQWYQQWLDAPATKVVPKTPDWIK